MAAPAPRPLRFRAARAWLQANLFSGWWNTLLTLATLAALYGFLTACLRWGLFDAVAFSGDRASCLKASGACWAFLREKADLILTGTYPAPERWRAYAATAVIVALIVVQLLSPLRIALRVGLLLGAAGASYLLLRGGVAGLPLVESHRWNGLPLVLFLSIFSMAAAFPLGIVLALARWSRNRTLNLAAIGYIETVRAIPMVAVLFVGVFVLPLVIARGAVVEPVTAILLVLTLFYAAYFAEDVRAGLQALPRGQVEAGASLGLSGWQRLRLIVLPQALRTAVPGLTNSVIGSFKDTSLVAIVGMHDLLSTSRMAYADPLWQAYALEANIAIGLFYFLCCWMISERGRRLGHPVVQRG